MVEQVHACDGIAQTDASLEGGGVCEDLAQMKQRIRRHAYAVTRTDI